MRSVFFASAALLALAGTPAESQYRGPGASYPAPGRGYPGAPPVVGGLHDGPGVGMRGGDGSRWGGTIRGRWYAGMTAPGGWDAYHRLHRGSHLAPYWLSPGFYIDDWETYGLGAPPPGFLWTRYYDDAVLIDGNGYVWDSVAGLDWDRYESESAAYDEGYHDGRAEAHAFRAGDRGYAPPPPVAILPPPHIAYGAVASSQVYVAPGTTVVTVSPSVMTTTTTTTTTDYVEEVARPRVVVRRRAWHAPKPSCVCVCKCPVRRWRPAPPPIMGS